MSARKLAAVALSGLLCLSGALSLPAHAAPGQLVEAPPSTLQECERELAEIDRRSADIEQRTGKLVAEIAMRERRSLARAKAYTRLVRAGLLPVAGGFDAFVAHAMKIEGSRRAIASDVSALKELRAQHIEISSARERIGARKSVVSAQRDALSQAQQLIAEAEERKRAFEKAFVSSTGASEHVAVYGASVTVHDDDTPRGIAALRGKLPFPITGRAETRLVRRMAAAGQGIEFGAPAGTVVRAVHAGRVAFSGRYSDYGRVVIIDHGDRYFSVSGNLGAVDVKVGDEVSTGARIGAVGDEGGNAALYFELRRGNETLEPKVWLGLTR